MIWSIFDRVYVRIDGTYDLNADALRKVDILRLLRKVAQENPEGDGTEKIYDPSTEQLLEKKAKKYIVRMANRFIADMPEILSMTDNMAPFCSLNQFNRLACTFRGGKKSISCYALVYIYVMYTLLEEDCAEEKECEDAVIALYELVAAYHEDNPQDELAAFLLGCFGPIIRAIREKNTTLKNTDIPARVRKHPKKDTAE